MSRLIAIPMRSISTFAEIRNGANVLFCTGETRTDNRNSDFGNKVTDYLLDFGSMYGN